MSLLATVRFRSKWVGEIVRAGRRAGVGKTQVFCAQPV